MKRWHILGYVCGFLGSGVQAQVQPQPIRCLHDLNTSGEQQAVSYLSTSGSMKTTQAQKVLPLEIIIPVLEEALAEHMSGDFQMSLDQNVSSFFVPENTDNTVTVTSFSTNEDKTHFTAVVMAGSEQEGSSFTLKGRLVSLVEVPVLEGHMGLNEPIQAHHLILKKVPRSKVSASTLTKTQDLLGCIVRSSAKIQQPLKISDVQRPMLIKKGQSVCVSLERKGLSLEMTGIALEDGEKDQRIKVLNPTSQRTLQGFVKDLQHVVIENNNPSTPTGDLPS